MKKIFTFFASLLVAISVFALDTNGNYGFKVNVPNSATHSFKP